MQRLKPEDVPGAILKAPNLADNTLVELKRWLLCRGLSCTGNKIDIITRLDALLFNVFSIKRVTEKLEYI